MVSLTDSMADAGGTRMPATRTAIADGACHHCGEALPSDPVRVMFEGEPRGFCCEGCAAAAQWIDDADLGDYYRLRSAPAMRPDPGQHSAALWSRAELSRLEQHEPRLGEVNALLDAALIDLDEAAAALARVRDDLDLDPERLADLDRRIGRLHDLARKHRVDLHQLADRRDALATELDVLRNGEGALERLRQERQQATDHWREAAVALTRARTGAAARLAEAVTTLLAELGMGGGRFAAALESAGTLEPDPLGAERVEFLVSANAGQPPRPLRKVASGGELSRISLAIEVAALGKDTVPTMVFDEVDSGIGGAVAVAGGEPVPHDLAHARDLIHRAERAVISGLPREPRPGRADGRAGKR